MTSHVGIIGYPLGHSISPAFQQAAFDHLGLDVAYERWATPPEELAGRLQKLRQSDCLGANVTVPHKEKVLPLLDTIDSLADRIGAVNTIVNRNGLLHGHNTDAEGFLRSLREEARFDPKAKRILIVGAGGVARAVAFGLAGAKTARILVANRTLERAERLVQAVASATDAPITATGLSPASTTEEFDLIVQCTSLGMKSGPNHGQVPPVADLISPDTLVYDLVYNPLETPLLRVARGRGARVLGGLGMLVYQGAAAFSLWTGREAPVDVMHTAAKQAL